MNSYYIESLADLPPCEGECERPGINWCWFNGYASKEIAAERYRLISHDEPMNGDILEDRDGTFSFRLHY